MSSKEQAHRNDKSPAGQRASKAKEQSAAPEDQLMGLASAVQKARRAPQALNQRDVPQLQRTIGNRAVARLLDGARPLEQRVMPSLTVPANASRFPAEAVLQGVTPWSAGNTSHYPIALHAVASGSGTVQRNIWSGWEPQFGYVAPKTERIAKLGMCIVDFLRLRMNVNVRIGGSLSAAMFGGRRKPGDIDIDIPGGLEGAQTGPSTADLVKERFMKLAGQKDVPLVTGNDLFFIKSLSKTSAGVRLVYLHTKTPEALDPFDDDEEIGTILTKMQHSPIYEVDVDFSPEEIFDMSGLAVDSEGAEHGYYGPEFLLAAYLNRLASNLANKEPDTKNDRGQITSLLSRLLSNFLEQRTKIGKGMGAEEMKNFLLEIKKSITTKHVNKKNEKLTKLIDVLFEEITPDVIKEFFFV